MTVHVWSDFMCPFCYLGKRRFELALQEFEQRDDVKVVFRSFELNPYAQVDGNPSVREMLAEKYGMTAQQVDENIKNITAQAHELGLDYNMDEAIQTNTFDAHRLTHWAREQGKDGELTERLFKAYFIDGLHIGDHDTLASLAEEVGMDRGEALALLESADFTEDVRADQMRSQQIGVRGVPHFVIDDKYVVRGAHPADTFVGALHKAWEERA